MVDGARADGLVAAHRALCALAARVVPVKARVHALALDASLGQRALGVVAATG